MHKKISVGLAVTIAIFTLIITGLVTTAVTMNIYSGLISDLPGREAMYAELAEADRIIRSEYYGTAEDETVNDGIVSGYMESLTVGENRYLTPTEYAAYKTELSGVAEDGTETQCLTYKLFGSAGYIKFTHFPTTAQAAFERAYNALLQEGIASLVIDVRDTDSGNIDAAAAIIDFIVPLAAEGTQAIATAIDKDGNNAKVFSADSSSIDLPVAVIINENTKGAGELIACDLRDFGKAALVGKTTAGDGMYREIFELSRGGALLLTTAQIRPYTSESYNGTGVTPDYIVDLAAPTDDLNSDTQFLQAYAAVQRL